jgi:hypothetical protein
MLRHGCGFKLANDGVGTRALQRILVRRDLKNVPRVRAVNDYLVDVFQRERRLLSG